MNRFLVTIAVLAGLAALAAGCGGGDSTTASLSKAEFVKRGNEICREGSEEIDSEFEEFAEEKGLSEGQRPSDAQLEEAAVDFFIPSINRQIEEISDLGAPEGDEETFDRFIANAEEQIAKAEDDPAVLFDEDEDLFREVNEEARSLNIPACGE